MEFLSNTFQFAEIHIYINLGLEPSKCINMMKLKIIQIVHISCAAIAVKQQNTTCVLIVLEYFGDHIVCYACRCEWVPDSGAPVWAPLCGHRGLVQVCLQTWLHAAVRRQDMSRYHDNPFRLDWLGLISVMKNDFWSRAWTEPYLIICEYVLISNVTSGHN